MPRLAALQAPNSVLRPTPACCGCGRAGLLDLLIEALLRYPDPVLVELAGRLVADKAPSCSGGLAAPNAWQQAAVPRRATVPQAASAALLPTGEKDFVALFDAESFGVFADVGRSG